MITMRSRLLAKAQQRVDQPRRVDGRYEDGVAPQLPRRRLGKELRQCDAGRTRSSRVLKDLGQPSAAFAD